MPDNIKKSPENKESSPIRELFHKNKSDVSEDVKDSEQETTESEKIENAELQNKAQEPKVSESADETSESENTEESDDEEFEDDFDDDDVETVPEPDVHEKHIGFRAVLSKMVEIITAPEDNEMFLGDEEEFEDIFSEDVPEPQTTVEKTK